MSVGRKSKSRRKPQSLSTGSLSYAKATRGKGKLLDSGWRSCAKGTGSKLDLR